MKRLIILLLVSITMIGLTGKARAADAKFGDSASAIVGAYNSDTGTVLKRILNPIGAGVTGVLDSAIVKMSPNYQAGDKQWAVVYLSSSGRPGTRIAVSTNYATTVGTGTSIETYKVAFNGETWDGGTDSLWIGGFLQPYGANGVKRAITDSAAAFAMYGVGYYWQRGYYTYDASVKLSPPGSSFDWSTYGTAEGNARNNPWIQIWYHTAGEHAPKIDLVPDSLGFAYTVSGADPASQSLYILDTATGDGPFAWTATYDSTWLLVSPASGSVSDTVTVTIQPPAGWTDTDAGTHIDTVWVACATADSTPMPMQVCLVVSASNTPTIAVTPTSLSFSRPYGAGVSPAKSLSISNVGTGTMVWTIPHDSTWLIPKVANEDSTGTGDLVVYWYVNPGSNPVGTYTDTLHVTCATASNSPFNIPVTMEITQAARPLMMRKNNP